MWENKAVPQILFLEIHPLPENFFRKNHPVFMKTLAFLERGGVYLPINLKPIKNQNKMKKLIYFAVCCIAAFSFSSCSKDYVGSERNLLGKWEFYREETHYWNDCEGYDGIEHKAGDIIVEEMSSKLYFTFKKNGTVIVESVGEKGETETEPLHYVFNKNSKLLIIEEDLWSVSRLTNSELELDDQWDIGDYWFIRYFRKVK